MKFLRPIEDTDLEPVIALDRMHAGQLRRGFFERRWQAMKREPKAYISLAIDDNDKLVGFLLAHILDGEFGGTVPVAVLDAVGVSIEHQGQRGGKELMQDLINEVRTHDGREIRTQAQWHEHELLAYFETSGFRLAPRLVLEREVTSLDEANIAGESTSTLARDEVFVRSLEERDLSRIMRIDERITSINRHAYYEGKISEALQESGIRISLVAESDNQVTGFVMAKLDYGDFGQAETTATIDTIGVDPLFTGTRIGQALISQLLLNLHALHVETVRTEVQWRDFVLTRFLARCGFEPSQHLALSMTIN